MAKIQVEANQCDRCGHIWLSENPVRCAKCKSPYWNMGAGPANAKQIGRKIRAQQAAASLAAEVKNIRDVLPELQPVYTKPFTGPLLKPKDQKGKK
jgi:hypothetical protein